jgi:light-regulated signal transduction histidine kinase (bacteriophytochrome)
MDQIKKIGDLIKTNKVLAEELIYAQKVVIILNSEKEIELAKLILANKELSIHLINANKELTFQNKEKGKRAAELKIAEKKLVTDNFEKEKRSMELNITNKELAFQNQINETLEQVIYVSSHNLQEPLRSISNYIQVLDEEYSEILDDNAKNYLKSIDNAAKRMNILIKSLLDTSRLGRNSYLIKLDFKKVIDEVIADLDTKIKMSNTIIDVSEMPSLNAYEVETRQLFQNLITNAIKFQKKDNLPRIKISCEKTDDKWTFSIHDNGIGISPIHFERIFIIFQRLHTDEEYEGNGIGLSNCKKIVDLHHGEIWVESKLGKGSTFYFTIPNLTL